MTFILEFPEFSVEWFAFRKFNKLTSVFYASVLLLIINVIDFSGLLERLSTFGSLLLITGDFNIPLDQPEAPNASKFQRLLKSFGLIQHVHSPTHRSQHTLDLLITRSSDCTLSDIHVHDMGLSDHSAVHSVLPLAKPLRETTRIVYRKLRRIDLASFSSDLQACLAITSAEDLSAFIDHYNTTLQDILNKHAPEKTKVITVRASAPWYSDEIDAGKKLRRKLERRWRKTKSLDDYNAYLLQCRRVQLLISSSKSDYYTSIIDENRTNQKALYKIMDHLLNRKATPQLPSLPPDDLPGKFATFFTDKIVSIRNGLSTYGDGDHLTTPAASTLLPYISKIVEKAVSLQISSHLEKNDLSDIYQSAYKKQHSIETALVRVQNDLLMALDSGCSVILLMLDLSAAFDTVDHSIMLHRLSFRFGIKEKALKWFESYLSDRRQAVVVDANTSSWHSLPFGVPQGSVLGPILFTMYISPLGDLVRQHNVSYHMYADDTQLYLSFRSNDYESTEVAKSSIEQCVLAIKKWMASNFLKLNDDKTELLVVYPKHIETPSLRSIAVGEEVINPSECARNIGVMLDQNLNMEQQITTICKSAFLHIRNIRKVRKYLPQHAAETVVNALVTSRLDNCNALLFGLPKNLLQKLQYVQNSAARLIMGTNKRDHIRPVLKKLHWLPIDNRIVFKILLLTFKARAKLAPQYIQDLINDYTPQRNLRSGSKCLLETPNYNLESYGKRAFSVAAPRLWNSLPMELKTSTSIDIFKKKLKTYLFNHSYF